MNLMTGWILTITAAVLLGGGMKPPVSTAADEIAEALPKEVEEYADRDSQGLLQGLEELLQKAPGLFFEELKPAVHRGVLIVAVAAVSGLVAPLAKGQAENMAELAGVAAVALLSLEGSSSVLEMSMGTVQELADWSAMTLPVMAVAAASSGSVNNAAMSYAAAALGMSILSRIVTGGISTFVSAYIALSVGGAAFRAPSLRKMAGVMKQCAKWIMTLLAGALFAYLVLSGMTASAADAVALRTAKTALGAIPVIGSITSEAASAVLSGTALIRGSAGLLGILGTLGICLAPFLKLLAYITMFRLTAALVSSFSQGSIPTLLEDLSGGCSFLLSACGLNALYLFFAIVLLMKGSGS